MAESDVLLRAGAADGDRRDATYTRQTMTGQGKLSREDRAALWRQYAQVHATVQNTFDSSVRTLAAAGVAVTVTIATAAVESFDWWGTLAVSGFLASLACNLASYVTAQKDMRVRLEFVRASDLRGYDETAWTTRTFRFNVGEGVSLILGGLLFMGFVASSV